MDPVLAAVLSSWAWRPDAGLALVLLAVGYSVGWWRLRRRAPGGSAASVGRAAAYLTGLLTVGVALLSPLDSLSAMLFSAHMVQHELLTMIAAPLLLLGNPLPVFLWALPGSLRRRAPSALARAAPLRGVLALILRPTVTWPLYMVTVWSWHFPSLYQTALRSELVHDLQHVTILTAGLLFWWPVVAPAPRLRPPAPYWSRILYVLAAAIPHMILVAPVALLRDEVLYPYYLAAPRILGLSVLRDQASGWVLMGFIDGLVFASTALVLVARMLESEERLALRRERVALTRAGARPHIPLSE
jgi:putative membrane protein